MWTSFSAEAPVAPCAEYITPQEEERQRLISTLAAPAAAAVASFQTLTQLRLRLTRVFSRRRSWFLSSLPAQPALTERGMFPALYRPLKITHSLTAMYGAGLTARRSQWGLSVPGGSAHPSALGASSIGRQ